MSSVSLVAQPGRLVASRNAVSAERLTIFEADDSTSCREFESNRKAPESCRPGAAEDHQTLTERVLTFLDKHAA